MSVQISQGSNDGEANVDMSFYVTTESLATAKTMVEAIREAITTYEKKKLPTQPK